MKHSDVWRRRTARHKMCLFAEFLYLHRAQMPYAEVRPMRSFHTRWCKVPRFPTDCSESLSLIARGSGAPTPYVQGNAGFTGTMLATLEEISFSQTRRGDFCVFVNAERPGGDHVVMFLEGGRKHSDPQVWSHGRPGVDQMALSQMKRGFPTCRAVYLRSVPERYSKAEKIAAQKA